MYNALFTYAIIWLEHNRIKYYEQLLGVTMEGGELAFVNAHPKKKKSRWKKLFAPVISICAVTDPRY